MTKSKICLLINYRTEKGGECSSKLTSQYCCKRLIKELEKDIMTRKLRQSIGGISTLHKNYVDDKWIRICPYCKAKIKMRKIFIDKIPYDFITKQEILGVLGK